MAKCIICGTEINIPDKDKGKSIIEICKELDKQKGSKDKG